VSRFTPVSHVVEVHGAMPTGSVAHRFHLEDLAQALFHARKRSSLSFFNCSE